MTEDNNTRTKIRRELEETRQGYHALVAHIPPGKYHLPTSNPAWNVGDTLYHMTLALRFMPADMQLIRRQRGFPRPPAALFNKMNEWYTRRGGRKAAPELLISEYDRVHAKLIAELDTVEDAEWQLGLDYPGWDPMLSGFVTLERLFHYVSDHFRAHAADLESVL